MRTQMKTTLLSLSLLAALGGVGSASANLVNGDFDQGFKGWSVQVETCINCNGSDDVSTVTADPSNETHHDASSGVAHLETDDLSFNTRDVFAITLFQDFIMDSLINPGDTLWLSLDLTAALDDVPGGDVLIAQLEDESSTNPLPTLDLSSGGPFDVTAFAGRSVEIAFGLQDLSFTARRDTLDVDNIRITAVPNPTPLWLLAAGLFGLGMRQRRDTHDPSL